MLGKKGRSESRLVAKNYSYINAKKKLVEVYCIVFGSCVDLREYCVQKRAVRANAAKIKNTKIPAGPIRSDRSRL